MKTKICLLAALFIFSGFQVLSQARWDIKESDPTVWVKFCDDINEIEFDEDDINDLPDEDPLDGVTPTMTNILASVLDDFNEVNASYLRLEVYTDDVEDEAKDRTIDVCLQNSNNPFEGGHALPIIEEGKLTGCEIVMIEDVEDDLGNFLSTLTHEIGHCIGLDHPQETRHSIMSYYHEDKVRLQLDDKIGLVHLYPDSDYDLAEQPNFGLSCSTR